MKALTVIATTLLALILGSCNKQPDPLEDLDKLVAEMEQRVIATTKMEKRGSLIPRYNQPKTIACLRGQFTVEDQLPDALRQGLFEEPATYPVMARFANASKWDDSEKDLRGLSLRVSNVSGDTIWGEPGYQDFLLNSYPALFVATPEEFLDFMRARQNGDKMSLAKFFLSPFDPHVKSLITVLKARKKHVSPLDIRYWSTVPSALDSTLGVDGPVAETTPAVKYSVTPCSTYSTEAAIEPGENQLRAALNSHLEQAEACFHFGVQRQANPETMPLDDASVIWDEESAPFTTVATITFDKPTAENEVLLDECEKSQFNPWQSLAAHTPLGRMNAVRKQVYASGAYLRANR